MFPEGGVRISEIQPMKTKKSEIPFNAEALVARVEGFAAGPRTLPRAHAEIAPAGQSDSREGNPRHSRGARLHANRVCGSAQCAEGVTAISWENGTRKPSGAALRLLAVAKHHPEALQAA